VNLTIPKAILMMKRVARTPWKRTEVAPRSRMCRIVWVIAFNRDRSSMSVRADRPCAFCRDTNFSTNSWIVRFLSSTISSFSKRCHASRGSLGWHFWDCRITPRMCFSSTASSASSTEPLRFVSNMNFSACSFVSKNQQQSFFFSANLAGNQTR
jgi:hypothetical protein